MPDYIKLIDPSKDMLAHWLKNARLGDQCQVITAQGDVYAHLTKLEPTTAKLPVTSCTSRETFLKNKIRFMELLETLENFAVNF